MTADHSILLTTDFSDISTRAFGPALSVARAFGSKIWLCYVQDDRLPPFMADYAGEQVLQGQEERRRRASEELAGLALRHLAGHDSFESLVLSGDPSREIVRFADERGIDLIVCATAGAGMLQHVLFGSTTERIVRSAPCPVLTINPLSVTA